jgi:MinD-like ATPase involved in chromosome partitioning or flagellar assembly
MHTVTFYSYKGGVGRTLAVANLAKYLAYLKRKVFVLDFDLEAPGIHYKLGEHGRPLNVQRGLVDVLYDFTTTDTLPERLEDYVIDVQVPGLSAGKIHLLGAGNAPSAQYWAKLAKINWHALFYSEQPEGIPLFLELKAFIRETYAPEFLLIDARTGITEMGGVATTVLADQVVCMMLPTREHLEGSREVMHAIRAALRDEGAASVDLMAVISPLPYTSKPEDEEAEVTRVREFLNEPVDAMGSSLAVEKVTVLHRDPALELVEQILVGSEKELDESQLLLDYHRLFVYLIPPSEVGKAIGTEIAEAVAQLIDSPDVAESRIEALARSCHHPEAYRALLRIYRVRNSPLLKKLDAAYGFWKITGDAGHPLLWDSIKDYRGKGVTSPKVNYSWRGRLEAVEAIWRARGREDSRLAIELADSYRRLDLGRRAIDVLLQNASFVGTPSAAAVADLVHLLDLDGQHERASELVAQFKERLASSPAFLEAWAKRALQSEDYEELRTVVDDPQFKLEVVEASSPALAARLSLFKTGDEVAARQYLDRVRLQDKRADELVQLCALARDLDRLEPFKVQLSRASRNAPMIIEGLKEWPPLPSPLIPPPPDDYSQAPDGGWGGDDDIPF